MLVRILKGNSMECLHAYLDTFYEHLKILKVNYVINICCSFEREIIDYRDWRYDNRLDEP